MAANGGAILSLRLKDDRFDNFITATNNLKNRLAAIKLERKRNGEEISHPTVADIEKTHTHFLQAAYRPFVNTVSEYVKVKGTSNGPSALTLSGGTSIEFKFPSFGQFTSDIGMHIRIGAIGTVNPVIATGVDNQNPPASPYYRYCAYPGLRIPKRVEFKSDNVVIDDYTRDEAVAHMKHFIGADQETGWMRMHGQQEVKTATYFNQQGFTGVFNYSDGLQTPKFRHEAVDLFVPLQFQMCRDASCAIFNDLMPATQRTITVELAPLGEIVQALTQQPEPSPGVYPFVATNDTVNPTKLPFGSIPIEATLYVNSMYVNPEIHDIFAARIGFQLIRVHRRLTKTLNTSTGSVLLNDLKWPTEYLMFGLRDRRNALNFDQWHLGGRAVAATDATKILIPAMRWNSTVAQSELVVRTGTTTTALDNLLGPSSSLALIAHGVPLYDYSPTLFYNGYLPSRYKDKTIEVSPRDPSQFIIPFCLYPGNSSVSGYYNMSSGRELYIGYRDVDADTDRPVELVCTASCVNFLVRKGDSYRLMYAV
jgi:hypothetical protein